MLDLQTIDNVYSTSSIPFNYKNVDKEELEMDNEEIKDQYINFNNLGVNLLNQIDNNEIKLNIITEMLDYINENYTSIIGLESVFSNDVEEMGNFVYQFICVDCPTMIFPNYINQLQISSFFEFEMYLKNKIKYEQSLFKNSLIICVKNILDQILKLSNIDKTVNQDQSYKKLVKKYSFYIDLLDFGDASNLLYNYTIPVMRKYFNDILWRST